MTEKKFKWIGFDADDTLWVNEPYFREAEEYFCHLMKDYGGVKFLVKELYQTEIDNIVHYGYGIKGFILSLIETAIKISGGKISLNIIDKITNIGKDMLNRPVELIDGIEDVLISLRNQGYKLIVVTKGDLLDQERKLKKSDLEKYFHHIEIVSDKQVGNYCKILNHLEIKPEQFLMVGNSLKSDILPVLELGAYGVHVPFHTTWIHEEVEEKLHLKRFWELSKVSDLIDIL